MNRRKAIGRIFLTGIGGGILFSGYEWYRVYRRPDLHILGQHRELITALADTIIPPSPDGPGAAEAEVTPFIIQMVSECMNRATANKFIAGLQDITGYCLDHFNQPFQHCKRQDREAALAHFEQRDRPWSGIAGKIQTRILGAPFFPTLKSATAIGYCTSEQGATKGLHYDFIPGSYHGCIPKSPWQKAWATK